MNLQQIRTLCEVVDQGLSISAAADSLGRSQSSVTRLIQELERELGLELFSRTRSRILSVTTAGEHVIAIARNVLRDLGSLRDLASDLRNVSAGDVTIATTHTQARYTLPDVVKQFARKLPDVRMRLRQGYPAQCEQAVVSGDADVALYTEVERPHPEVAFIPIARLRRSVITPPRHELLRQTPLTLNAVARHPIITYDEAFSGRRVLDRAFEAKGLKPNIVMTAIDADVSKAYVELGIGIAILATITFDQKRDWPLRRIDASHLFPSSLLGVAVRRKGYLRRPVLTLVSLLAPSLGQRSIEKALATGSLPIKNLPEF